MAMFSRKPKKSKKKKDNPVVDEVSSDEETVADIPVVVVDEPESDPLGDPEPAHEPEAAPKKLDGAPEAHKVRLVYETHTAMVYVIKREFIAEVGAKKVCVLKEGHRPTA